MKRVPSISLFAGDDRTVEEGDEVDYSASFTRPEELSDFEYRWSFGDGKATVQGTPEEGATRVTVPHTYQVYRPDPYKATITVTALSEAGRVNAVQSFWVYTSQTESFIVAGWDVTGTTKSAVRALSVLARAATIVLIWALVFSPVVLAIAAIIYLMRRYKPQWLTPPSGLPGPATVHRCRHRLRKLGNRVRPRQRARRPAGRTRPRRRSLRRGRRRRSKKSRKNGERLRPLAFNCADGAGSPWTTGPVLLLRCQCARRLSIGGEEAPRPHHSPRTASSISDVAVW